MELSVHSPPAFKPKMKQTALYRQANEAGIVKFFNWYLKHLWSIYVLLLLLTTAKESDSIPLFFKNFSLVNKKSTCKLLNMFM